MKHNQSPDWRWLRARDIADAGSMPRRLNDDKYVKKAYKFLMQLRRNDPKAELRLESAQPDLYHAFKIYEAVDMPMRWLLEAGVMAEQAAIDMAEYLNTTKKVVETYEKIFFDVRDALNNRGCIISNVLAHGVMGGVLPRTPDVLWKALAYAGGWGAVQAVVEYGYIPPAVVDFYRQNFMNAVIINGSITAKSVRVNDHTAADHERLALDLIRQEEELGSAKTGDVAHTAMGGLLKSIQLSVLPSGAQIAAEEPRLQHVALPVPRVVEIEEEKKK